MCQLMGGVGTRCNRSVMLLRTKSCALSVRFYVSPMDKPCTCSQCTLSTEPCVSMPFSHTSIRSRTQIIARFTSRSRSFVQISSASNDRTSTVYLSSVTRCPSDCCEASCRQVALQFQDVAVHVLVVLILQSGCSSKNRQLVCAPSRCLRCHCSVAVNRCVSKLNENNICMVLVPGHPRLSVCSIVQSLSICMPDLPLLQHAMGAETPTHSQLHSSCRCPLLLAELLHWRVSASASSSVAAQAGTAASIRAIPKKKKTPQPSGWVLIAAVQTPHIESIVTVTAV